MSHWPEHIAARSVHRRKGSGARTFSYNVDFVLIDPKATKGPELFSRNRFNLLSVWDRDHGGQRGSGSGLSWAEGVFDDHGVRAEQILLLTQPRFLWVGFNPVSFWLAMRDGALVGAIAEVNNTFGDRHNYLCVPEGQVISPDATLSAKKQMHVSPFQEVSGEYLFNFNILTEKLSIKINLSEEGAGFFANLTGHRQPLRSRTILGMLFKRPFGALRTIVLIYWQALKLKFQGETYRPRPAPPQEEIS